jgi:capsid protein
MKVLSHPQMVLSLTALMLVCGLAGFLVGHRVVRKQIEVRNDPGAWNEHVAREFDRIVQPTPEQGSRIQARLDYAVKELQDIRLDTIARSTNVIWRLIAEVEKELTPEQLKAFEQMKPRPADLTLDLLRVEPQKTGTNSPNK